MKSESRNVYLSVEYRIWGILRQQGWYNQFNGVTLTPLSGIEELTQDPYPANTFQYQDYIRPIVFIDEFNNPSPSGLVVYVNNVPQPSGNYTVDWIDQRITFPAAPTGTVTADMTLFDVMVREGYPEQHELQVLDLPVIAVEIINDDGRDAVLGTFLQFNNRFVNLFVMAKNRGQRMDLTNDMRRWVRFVPYIDYSWGEPLDENNALDLSFNYADALIDRMACPHGVKGDYLQPRQGGLDKERYRSLISFELERIS